MCSFVILKIACFYLSALLLFASDEPRSNATLLFSTKYGWLHTLMEGKLKV